MKRNDKTQLLAQSSQELRDTFAKREVELLKAMQERNLPNRAGADVKKANRIRTEIKMIKTELRKRELQAEEVQE